MVPSVSPAAEQGTLVAVQDTRTLQSIPPVENTAHISNLPGGGGGSFKPSTEDPLEPTMDGSETPTGQMTHHSQRCCLIPCMTETPQENVCNKLLNTARNLTEVGSFRCYRTTSIRWILRTRRGVQNGGLGLCSTYSVEHW